MLIHMKKLVTNIIKTKIFKHTFKTGNFKRSFKYQYPGVGKKKKKEKQLKFNKW